MSKTEDLEFKTKKLLFITKHHKDEKIKAESFKNLAEIYVQENESGKLVELARDHSVDLQTKLKIGEKLVGILEKNDDLFGMLDLAEDENIPASIREQAYTRMRGSVLNSKIEEISKYEKSRAAKNFEEILSKNLYPNDAKNVALNYISIYDDFLLSNESREVIGKMILHEDEIFRQSAEITFNNGIKKFLEINNLAEEELYTVYNTLVSFAKKPIDKDEAGVIQAFVDRTVSRMDKIAIEKHLIREDIFDRKIPSYIRTQVAKSIANVYASDGDYNFLLGFRKLNLPKEAKSYFSKVINNAFETSLKSYALEGQPVKVKGVIDDYETKLSGNDKMLEQKCLDKNISISINNAIKNDDVYEQLNKVKDWNNVSEFVRAKVKNYLNDKVPQKQNS